MHSKTKDCPDCGGTCGEEPVHKYLDLNGASPRIGFETKQELPPKLEVTPEGYLLCKDVALARTGTQIYRGWEVPVEPGPDGTVVIERPEEEVFRPETVASFNGKPFTNDHPTVDVSPANYKELMIGTIMNPRRGDGDRSHCLVGDIIVYDAAVVSQILAGKREVSCGYDANYVKISPGHGKQTEILGNHVSLVQEGRCGPTCAITDEKEPKPMAKKNWMDGLRAAFKAKDEDAFEEAINEAKKEGVDESDEPERMNTEEKETSGSTAGNEHHVTVNIGGMTPDSMAAMRRNKDNAQNDTQDEEPEGMDPAEMIKAAVAEALAPVMARLDSIENAVEDVSDPNDVMTTDAVARAEILKPGISLPTFDAKPGSKAARDAVVAFQRKTLSEAYGTKDGKAAIQPLVGSTRPNFTTMDASVLNVVFRGASERMRDMNNARRGTDLPFVADGNGGHKVFDNKTWNERNKDFWKRA